MNSQLSEYKKRTILLIVAATVVRLLLSGLVELNNDEVHYWTYGKQLQWNYFDHPPMIGAWIRFFTAGLQLNHEFFIRLPAVVSSAICTWLIFITGKKIKDEYTGWIAACLFTASFYSSVIAGIIILPDSPQMVFWLLDVYLMVGIIKERDRHRITKQLLLVGVVTGLCMLSKIHGVFCWIGFGGYILFHKREFLKNSFLYISVLLTAVMLIPSLLWLLNNDMSTYDYHSSRVGIHQIQTDSFFRELFGSFMYNTPINTILLVVALIYYRRHVSFRNPAFALLLWLGLPLIITVLFLSLFNDTFPHWSGPAYTTLILITACYISILPEKPATRITKFAIGLTAAVLMLAIGIINYWPGTLGNKTMPDYGKNDVTLDMSGWRQFGQSFKQFYQQDTIGSVNDTPHYIFSDYWFPAAHLDFYVARPMQLSLKAIGTVHDIHHYAWLNRKLPPLKKGETVYYITISNFYSPPKPELTKYFESAEEPVIIPQLRSNKTARYFYIYTLRGYLGGAQF